MSHDRLAGGGRKDIVAESDNPARGDLELDVHSVVARLHGDYVSLAASHHIYHFRTVFFRHIDAEGLHRLASAAVDFFNDHLRLPHLKFIAFTAHCLDQDGEVEHSTAIHYPHILPGAFLHAQGEILVELTLEALLNMTGSDIFSIFPEERRVIDGECHRHGRLVDSDAGKGFGIGVEGDGIPDLEVFEAHYGADVSAHYLLHFFPAHTLESMEFLDFLACHATVSLAESHFHAFADSSAVHTAHGDAAHIARIIEAGDQHLHFALYLRRSRDISDDRVEKRCYVVCRGLPVVAHPVLLCRTVYCRELKLLLGGVEIEHQVEHHLVDLVGTAVGFVHLVHDHNRFQPHLNGLLKHEAGLGHRAFESVYKQQTSVRHVEHTLHLAAEVGVSRRVYDIYFGPLVVDRHVFRENCDSPLPLQVVVVEDKFTGTLVLPEEMAGEEHFVYECGLAMIHMRDNRDITDVLHQCIILYRSFFTAKLQKKYQLDAT